LDGIILIVQSFQKNATHNYSFKDLLNHVDTTLKHENIREKEVAIQKRKCFLEKSTNCSGKDSREQTNMEEYTWLLELTPT
jgi:hypothetical protein